MPRQSTSRGGSRRSNPEGSSSSSSSSSSTTVSRAKCRVPGLLHLPLDIKVGQLVQRVDAVLASGLGHNLIDREFCREVGIPTEPKDQGAQTTITPLGGRAVAITHQTKRLRLTAVCGHSETVVLDVLDSKGLWAVALGRPWFGVHNPDINFGAGSIWFVSDYCRTNCLPPDISLAGDELVQPPRSEDDTVVMMTSF